MAVAKNRSTALIPIAMVPIVAAITSNGRIGDAFGMSGDFWTGALMGVGIGLLLLSIAVGLRASRRA